MISIPDYVDLRHIVDDECGRPWYGFIDGWSDTRIKKAQLEAAVAGGISPQCAIVTFSARLLWGYYRDPVSMIRAPVVPAVQVKLRRDWNTRMAKSLRRASFDAVGLGVETMRISVPPEDMDTICGKLAEEIAAEYNRICINGASPIAAGPAICPDCHGKKVYEGLIFDRYDCPTCNGTGKVHQ